MSRVLKFLESSEFADSHRVEEEGIILAEQVPPRRKFVTQEARVVVVTNNLQVFAAVPFLL